MSVEKANELMKQCEFLDSFLGNVQIAIIDKLKGMGDKIDQKEVEAWFDRFDILLDQLGDLEIKGEIDKENALENIAHEVDGKLRDDYSGRGMYGETCYAIACEDAGEVQSYCRLYGLPLGRVDQMGLGQVVYWPEIKPEKQAEENE